MKRALVILFLFWLFLNTLFSQSRAELEAQRKKTMDELSYIDNLLQTTSRERQQNINSLSIISNRLALREKVLAGMREEISLLNSRIGLNTLAISMMENDLTVLKQDYAKAVVNSYRTLKGYPLMVYILSANDFNQGYKRMKYLQQIVIVRRNSAEIIGELKEQVENSKEKLSADLKVISDLRAKEESQRILLVQERRSMQQIINTLNNRRSQLQRDLDAKRRVAQQIEREIQRLIEEERKRAETLPLTPEQRLLGTNFSDNKGRLPWPVDRGIVTSRFGVRRHPELSQLTENNIGIEITSSGSMPAKAVFRGEVARVFAIPGANMTVILRHGNYMSVYANLINVKVKTGAVVTVGQVLGDIYADPGNNATGVLKFMIFENTVKYLDPELWLVKR
jgi:septal ring factor EnvC (AmiA/AmiB activator)